MSYLVKVRLSDGKRRQRSNLSYQGLIDFFRQYIKEIVSFSVFDSDGKKSDIFPDMDYVAKLVSGDSVINNVNSVTDNDNDVSEDTKLASSNNGCSVVNNDNSVIDNGNIVDELQINFPALISEVSSLRSEVMELKQMIQSLLECNNDDRRNSVSVESVGARDDSSDADTNLSPSYFAVKKRKSDFRIYWLPAVRSLARYIISNRSCGIRTTYQMMADFLNSQGFRTVRGGDIIVSNIVRLQPLINEVLSETELSDRNKNLL